MQQVHDYILAEIFSCLVDLSCPRYTAEVLGKVSRVCKRWREVVLGPYCDLLVWSQMDPARYFVSRYTMENVAEIIRLGDDACPVLPPDREIERKCVPLLAGRLVEVCQCNPEMKPEVRLAPVTADAISELYQRDAFFRHIANTSCTMKHPVNPPWANHIMKIGDMWSRMRHLRICVLMNMNEDTFPITEEPKPHVMEMLSRAKNLRSLRLDVSSANYSHESGYFPMPKEDMVNLRKLKIKQVRTFDCTNIVLAAPNLEKLEVWNGYELALCADPKRLKSLKIVEPDTNLWTIVNRVLKKKKFECLKRISLTMSSITDPIEEGEYEEGGEKNPFMQCDLLSTVEKIDIHVMPGGSHYSDGGKLIEAILSKCKKGLTSLRITGISCSITDEEMRSPILRTLKRLEVRCMQRDYIIGILPHLENMSWFSITTGRTSAMPKGSAWIAVAFDPPYNSILMKSAEKLVISNEAYNMATTAHPPPFQKPECVRVLEIKNIDCHMNMSLGIQPRHLLSFAKNTGASIVRIKIRCDAMRMYMSARNFVWRFENRFAFGDTTFIIK